MSKTLPISVSQKFIFFFFNDTATTEIYTLSLHDALPISLEDQRLVRLRNEWIQRAGGRRGDLEMADQHFAEVRAGEGRSEEHTSELQSPCKSRMPSSA